MRYVKKSMRALAAAGILLGTLPSANGAILIDNWNITTTTLSFTFSGSIDPGTVAGPTYSNVFYIGDGSAFNTSWILSGYTNGSYTALSGDDGLVSSAVGASDDTNGDWFSIRINESDIAIITSGDYFNISVSATGSFDPDAIDTSDIKVALGFDLDGNVPLFPDADHIVGGIVPEPTSAVLMGLGVLGFTVVRRRR